MSALLEDYERKRGRAMHHFAVLRDAVDRSANLEAHPVVGGFEPGRSRYVFHVPLQPIDPDWALLLGDFVYNTRASLDYLITALIRSTGGREDGRSEFPIYSATGTARWLDIAQRWDDDRDRRLARQLSNTPAGTKEALKRLQPFYGVPRVNPLKHPLLVLQTLSNRDKHRRLNLLAHGVWTRFVDAATQPIFAGPALRSRLVETRQGDAWTVTLAVDRRHHQEIYLLPSYDISLNEPPEAVGGVVTTLAAINEFIDRHVLPTVLSTVRSTGHDEPEPAGDVNH